MFLLVTFIHRLLILVFVFYSLQDGASTSGPIRFDPSSLDFREQWVLLSCTLKNKCINKYRFARFSDQAIIDSGIGACSTVWKIYMYCDCWYHANWLKWWVFITRFLPLTFRPVGMPHMEQVTVHNPDPHTNLHLLSISGSTLHFHCSFFQDKVSQLINENLLPRTDEANSEILWLMEAERRFGCYGHIIMNTFIPWLLCHLLQLYFFYFQMVPPGGNTTFDVVFLARQQGAVENTLYIHTTLGSFKYQVSSITTKQVITSVCDNDSFLRNG